MASEKAKQHKKRTYARNRHFSRKGNEKIYESDSHYFLKLVVVFLLGTFWLKFAEPIDLYGVILTGVPVGFLIGLLLVNRYEKFQFNRKIWYAVLFFVTVLSYFLPAGIVI